MDKEELKQELMKTSTCPGCKEPLKLGVQVMNTNIAFIVITTDKLYGNDDRPLKVCRNKACEFFGLVRVDLTSPTKDNE